MFDLNGNFVAILAKKIVSIYTDNFAAIYLDKLPNYIVPSRSKFLLSIAS